MKKIANFAFSTVGKIVRFIKGITNAIMTAKIYISLLYNILEGRSYNRCKKFNEILDREERFERINRKFAESKYAPQDLESEKEEIESNTINNDSISSVFSESKSNAYSNNHEDCITITDPRA